MRPCLIVNPLSFLASRGLAERAIALANELGVEVVTIDSPSMLTATIESMLTNRRSRLMVLAGDGTVRAVIDQLASLAPGAWTPDLVILPGGRTNLIAADVGSGDAMSLFRRAVGRAREARWDAAVEERAVLRIEQSPGPTRYGLFVGAALVDAVIRRTHRYREQGSGAWRAGPLSAPWSVVKLGLLALIGRSGLHCPTMTIDAPGVGKVSGPMRLLLASTLLHRRGLLDPYAKRGQGDLRVTAASRHADAFWWRLPRIVTGRFLDVMSPSNGYLSGRFDRVDVTGCDGYSLDGEPFPADATRPLTITAGPRLRFLIP